MTKEQLDAIATREAHCKPFGAAVTLSVGERDALVALARSGLSRNGDAPEIDQEDETAWAARDPAIAFQTIDREAVDWGHVGVLMERWARAWVKANPEKEEHESI